MFCATSQTTELSVSFERECYYCASPPKHSVCCLPELALIH